MSAGLIKGESDQACLKSLDFVVEINARRQIEGLQAIRYVGERLVTSQILRLPKQRGGEIAETLHAVSLRLLRYPQRPGWRGVNGFLSRAVHLAAVVSVQFAWRFDAAGSF